MAQVHTHYDNLKVARDAPPEVIRAAYKTLCQKYHPDRNGNSADALRVIQIINTAYTVLSDPEKRREHDEWIARAEAMANDQGTRQRAESRNSHDVARPSHRSRHRSSAYPSFVPEYRPSQKLAKAVVRMLSSLDHFSRKLFRKP